LGDPKGYSAMALSVGITCGIVTQLLLDGHPALNTPGVLAPYKKEMCDPIREIVEREGVKMVEKILQKISVTIIGICRAKATISFAYAFDKTLRLTIHHFSHLASPSSSPHTCTIDLSSYSKVARHVCRFGLKPSNCPTNTAHKSTNTNNTDEEKKGGR
jgi:gamma-glutamyl-gamma-aminobutyrate hydrolase PuuD